MSFSEFIDKKKGCEKCKFFKREFVPPDVYKNAKIMLVGDSPWTEEVKHGQVFKGPSGQKLNEFLSANDLDRNEIYITNSVKCKPHISSSGGPAPIPPEVTELCKRLFLVPEILQLKPNIIVPMGDAALYALTKQRGITKKRGFVFYHDITNGKKTFTAKVLPTFHPAYILRSQHMAPFSIADFRQVKEQQRSNKIIDASKKTDYKALTSVKETLHFLNELEASKAISIDLETTGLDYAKDDILCIAMSPKVKKSRVLNLRANFPKKIKWAYKRKILQKLYDIIHSGRLNYGQNFKFDLHFLHKLFLQQIGKGIDIRKVNWREVLLLQMLLDENIPKDLKSLTHMLEDIRYTKEEVSTVKGGTLVKASLKDRSIYAAKDTDATLRIGKRLVKRVKSEEEGVLWKLFKEEEMPFSKCLFDMELFGMHVSNKRINELDKRCKQKLRECQYKMYQLVGRKFNIRSQKELPIVLFKELKIKGNINFLTTKTKVFSTGKAHIEWLIANESHPFLKILKNYRAYDKIKSTFVDGLRAVKDENNILHTNFLVWGTVSGRPSSKNPNLLNIPKDKLFSDKELMSVRRIFTARKGHQMIVVDFSQIELKLVALLAYVKLLLRGLKKGEDFHTLTARDMYGNIFKRAETIVLKGVWKGKKFLKKVRERYRQRMETMRSKSKTFNFLMVFQAGDEP